MDMYYFGSRAIATLFLGGSLLWNARGFREDPEGAVGAFGKDFCLWLGFLIPLVGEVGAFCVLFWFMLDEGFEAISELIDFVLRFFSKKILSDEKFAQGLALVLFMSVLVCSGAMFFLPEQEAPPPELKQEEAQPLQLNQYRLICTVLGDSKVSCVREGGI